MPVETIKWENGKVKLIDQTILPHKFKYIICKDAKSLWHAIKTLKVRGAPAIGIAAAFGVILGIKDSKAKRFDLFFKELRRVTKYLASARPTAINLFWALARMECVAKNSNRNEISKIKKILLKEALKILDEDKKSCRRMAKYGSGLVKDGDSILTHCNAGGLATADYGTALGVLFEARKQGKSMHVYVDETRPLLQGARLTAWELIHEGIDTTLICDNMAASLMAKGKIDKIFVGADRIARNGDAANKIGTYNLAILARHHHIPFYVVAPLSSFDFRVKTGADIPIEERDGDEVRKVLGRVMIAPRNVKVYNPAFDVTPNKYITAIVTEKGIFKRPYSNALSVIARSRRRRSNLKREIASALRASQ
ncbi:MAG: S-methyl-5-thioribose-1-phosphate isomerase [Omnitrophica bacterium RIFCSPLOWO2_01_FULL_45_10]|nr:MAG: S-methyl-5-thioribose-1-phosphate isomerase [Omnitrophica bacterium RIFCSPLOWO2_01_FULL_45_10]